MRGLSRSHGCQGGYPGVGLLVGGRKHELSLAQDWWVEAALQSRAPWRKTWGLFKVEDGSARVGMWQCTASSRMMMQVSF